MIAGVLWIFMFSPSIGVVAYFLGKLGYDWNHLMNENQAMALIVLAAVEADFLQLPVLPRRTAVHSQGPDRSSLD